MSAFDFGRKFRFYYLVNWQFLGEEITLSPITAKILLLL